jgi:hypothetical protein
MDCSTIAVTGLFPVITNKIKFSEVTSPIKVKIKVKLKLSLRLAKHHAMKTCWGSGVIAPRILNPSVRWS